MKTLLCNSLWAASCLSGSMKFANSAGDVRRAQEKRLSAILRDNARTEFGRQHGFSRIRSPDEFRSDVPLCEYEDLKGYIERIAEGETDILFPGRPLRLVPTSGTTSGTKLIPYTEALRREFQAGISPWIYDMFKSSPRLLAGRSYWSVSPSGRKDSLTSAGIKIGFDDDAEYLGPVMGRIFGSIAAVPPCVSRIGCAATVRRISAACLLKAAALSIISVWNPSFLLLLLKEIEDNLDLLIGDVRAGRISGIEIPDRAVADNVLRAFGPPSRARADEIEEILKRAPFRSSLGKIWPGLGIISCWKDAAAALPAKILEGYFPETAIVGKGLIATEGFVSFPLTGSAMPVLSVNSHFFEFLPAGGAEDTVFPWELEEEKEYSVVLTTGGGLYRYRLHDLIKVRGFFRGCPALEFVGRDNGCSDFHGEKICEHHVLEALKDIFCGDAPGFALLAPFGEPVPDRYVLHIAGINKLPQEAAAILDASLRKNIHYDHCRNIGQLKAPEISVLGVDAESAARMRLELLARQGCRLGDVKPSVLSARPLAFDARHSRMADRTCHVSENEGKTS